LRWEFTLPRLETGTAIEAMLKSTVLRVLEDVAKPGFFLQGASACCLGELVLGSGFGKTLTPNTEAGGRPPFIAVAGLLG